MSSGFPYHIYPLGDTAVSIDFGNVIDRRVNDRVMTLYQYILTNSIPGITDVVPAYSSLTIHYNSSAWLSEIRKGLLVSDIVIKILEAVVEGCPEDVAYFPRNLRIPVCYGGQYGPDLDNLAGTSNTSVDHVIALHTADVYHVYMLGFLPGFAYMGEVNEVIATQRKPRPERITAGSVGIAGRQTGIYPLDSPGGWQIIGRTPLTLFNLDKGETLLRPGDRVQFYSISADEFEHY